MLGYIKKKKFINRGLYFINEGEYKGCFAVNIKEFGTVTHKALMLFPNREQLTLSTDEVSNLFDSDGLKYEKRIPKWVYNVCLAQFKEDRTDDTGN